MYTLRVNKVQSCSFLKGTAPVTAFFTFFFFLRVYANYLLEHLLHQEHGYDAYVGRSLHFITEPDSSSLMFLEVHKGQTGTNVNHSNHPTPHQPQYSSLNVTCPVFPLSQLESDALCSISLCKGQYCHGVERVPPLMFQCSLFILLIQAYPLKQMELDLVFQSERGKKCASRPDDPKQHSLPC